MQNNETQNDKQKSRNSVGGVGKKHTNPPKQNRGRKGGIKPAHASRKNKKRTTDKGGQGDFVDALTCSNLKYYTPAGRLFTNCKLQEVYNHYCRTIRNVFGFTPTPFVSKENLQKQIQFMQFEKETLFEIIKNLNELQNEI